MPGIIALALIAIVALTVLSFAVHVLFSRGCWWPSPSWPGSSSGRAAPTGSPDAGARCPAGAERAARQRRHGPGIALHAHITDRNIQAARDPPFGTL